MLYRDAISEEARARWVVLLAIEAQGATQGINRTATTMAALETHEPHAKLARYTDSASAATHLCSYPSMGQISRFHIFLMLKYLAQHYLVEHGSRYEWRKFANSIKEA